MSSLRSIVAGSKLRIVASLVVSLLLLVAGGIAGGVIGPPAVNDVENRFGTVTDETTEIETNISVHNPNPIGLNLSGTTVRYEMRANGVPLASGEKQGLAVQRGNSTVQITTLMENDRIPDWWVAHVRNGERTTMTVDAIVDVGEIGQSFTVTQERSTSTDILGEFGTTEPRQVNAETTGVQDPILIIEETSAEWGSVNEARTPIDVEFEARNPQDIQPVTIVAVGYDITMNGIAVGSGVVEQNRVIAGGQTKTIPLTTAIDNAKLDEWWVSHLERNQVTEFKIEFYITIELQNGRSLRIPMKKLAYTDTIETDILGSKPAPDEYTDDAGSGSDSGSSGDDGDTGEGTKTPDSSTSETETPDQTGGSGDGTATSTPTATPEDDGLL
jgi:LEA14-like dessication related protein